MGDAGKKRATYADLEAVPPHLVAEIIDGKLVTRPVGKPVEAMARTALSAVLSLHLKQYLILHQFEVRLDGQVVVPELGRWNRSDLMQRADDAYLDVAPDWVCSLRSDRTSDDVYERRRTIYAEWGVAHLWSINVQACLLEAFELHQGSWRLMRKFGIDDAVSTAPFDNLRFPLADLWPLNPSAKSEHVH